LTLVLDCDPTINFSPSLGWQACATMLSFFPLRWGLANFLLGLPGTMIFLILVSCIAGMISIRPCTQLLVEIWSQTFCLDWPQTVILLISASQVARITGMNYWWLAEKVFFRSRDLWGIGRDSGELI
jgi:hypothetical protein